MTEEGEVADFLGGGRKQSRRERFREQLLKKIDRSDKPKAKQAERDEDLNEFLKSPPEGDALPPHPSPSRKPVPRINVSSSPRWPDTPGIPTREGTDHHNDGQQEALPYFPLKVRRREGLKVGFTQKAPQIIGEGGDEAEAPTIWITQSRQSSSAHPPIHRETLQNHAGSVNTVSNPTVQASKAITDPAREESRPRMLVRAPTGFEEAETGQETVIRAKGMKSAEFEPTVTGGNMATPAVPSDSNLLPSSAAGLKRKMLAEEARAFTSGLRDTSPEPSHQQQSITPPRCSQENLLAYSTASHIQWEVPPIASSNHLSPRGHSPSPSRPSSSSSHGSMTADSSARQSFDRGRGSNHTRPHVSSSPKRKPLPRAPSSDSKEDALIEFRSRARRYYGLFILATEKTEPGLDAPLSRWIRAAAWWFLTAESNFKLLRKDLEDGVNILQITASRRHMQAAVDLAKTAWIIEDIVQDYAKAESIDLSTPESIHRLIQSNPLSRFSRTLQYWQDLSQRFGSLVAAIRRNGFMTSASENQPLSPGIDSTIWLTYPVSDLNTANWVRSANPSWVKMEDSVTPVEPFDLAKAIPLKSTANTFRIRSIFCQTVGGFLNHHRSPSVPCILTIGRRSGSYALVLFVASQDHGINVVIETDPVRGDGMEWQQNSFSILFSFADDFQFLIQLQQAEYFLLKESYDLAMRSSTATVRDAFANANLGEKLIFRATSRTFERRSLEKINSFPYKGEQRDCEIILFEKYEMIRSASATRKAHRGIRLSVMLSPSAAYLGILDVQLGRDKPILLHSAHEFSPPLVEIMDYHRASLIIQFPQNRDFNRFYELLTTLEYSAAEDHSLENVPLRSLLIEPASAEAKTFLGGVPWRNVQITKGKAPSHQANHTMDILRSLSINICVFSNHGVFADRLHEGLSTSLTVFIPFSY
jgi:hypothetical protein